MALLKDSEPLDVKGLNRGQLSELCEEIRERILLQTSRNGGHLASNLGAVELTVALHRVFDFPRDQVIFDVGHQCYTHKLLTGRAGRFATLRQFGGLAGFPRREESPYDAFDTGHASTAISAAAGLARAEKIRHRGVHVVAVVGDGALTGGMCYEALNDAGSSHLPMIVVLNDNQMSISHNVGAVSRYLSYMRSGKGWHNAKEAVHRFLARIPVAGAPLQRFFGRIKNSLRNIFIQDRLFDTLGFHYLGPVDGQDILGMERLLRRAKALEEPVLIHVITKKGQGYAPAENAPTQLHGTPPFSRETGLPLHPPGLTLGASACDEVLRQARDNPQIVVVTAAMTDSVGMTHFAEAFPDRLYDVGIAEEHAVTMAAGLAAGGLRPVVAIYDTFLQRAYDQLLQDVCLQKLPVLFLIDRAGLSEDGATHQGVYGLSYLRQMPGLHVWWASTHREARAMVRRALALQEPVAICYGKQQDAAAPPEMGGEEASPAWHCLRPGKDFALLVPGPLAFTAAGAANRAAAKGVDAAVYCCSVIAPCPVEALERIARAMPFYTVEENMVSGGFGSLIAETCLAQGLPGPRSMEGIRGFCLSQGSRQAQLQAVGLDEEGLLKKILCWGGQKTE